MEYECDSCGGTVLEEDAYDEDGRVYCQLCFNEIYFLCPQCDEYHVRETSGERFYMAGSRRCSEFICEGCFENTLRCDNCGTSWHVDDMFGTHYDTDICVNCFNNSSQGWFRCDGCSEVFDGDDYGGEGYCQTCYDRSDDDEERDSDDDDGDDHYEPPSDPEDSECHCPSCERERELRATRALKSYGYKPLPVFHGGVPGLGDIFYGMELETDSYMENRHDPLDVREVANLFHQKDKYGEPAESDYYMKTDGSLHNGIEFVFHPRTIKNWISWKGELVKLCSKVVMEGGRSYNHRTCGVHIHRDVWDLSPYQKTKIITAFIILRQYIEVVAQRPDNPYSSFRFHEEQCQGNYRLIYKNIKNGDASMERHVAVNIQNNHTIEFRVFRGTLKAGSLINYLLFTDSMVEFIKSLMFSDLVNGGQKKLWMDYKAFAKTYLKSQYNELGRYFNKRGV